MGCKKILIDIGDKEIKINKAKDDEDISKDIENQEMDIANAIKSGCNDTELFEQEKSFCDDVKKTVGFIETEINKELSKESKSKEKLHDLYLQKQVQITRFDDSGCK